jgi:hypothetical protein
MLINLCLLADGYKHKTISRTGAGQHSVQGERRSTCGDKRTALHRIVGTTNVVSDFRCFTAVCFVDTLSSARTQQVPIPDNGSDVSTVVPCMAALLTHAEQGERS